ncbi:hypothetical protein D9757_009875 [Collybiopsis confluens]|uniref:Uncharacterized protein n=1 Tax=Collybiopsis confluens TaxID=2823264 RepID=A0A8H5GU52_9AGAR|nr:hypothetical protein D9757_009875 [Collybiopsis confluens]
MEPHPDETVCFQPLVTLTDAGGTKSGVSLRCFSWTLYALSLVNPVEVPGVTAPKLGHLYTDADHCATAKAQY